MVYEVLIQSNDELTPANVINVSNFLMQGNHCSEIEFLVPPRV